MIECRFVITGYSVYHIYGYVMQCDKSKFQEVDTGLEHSDKEYKIAQWDTKECYTSFDDARVRAVAIMDNHIKNITRQKELLLSITPEHIEHLL